MFFVVVVWLFGLLCISSLTHLVFNPTPKSLGNHDIWTGGSPSKGLSYDPLQYSLQYLGLDTVAGLDSSTSTGSWFNYQINPDDPPAALGTKYQSIEATSSITNSISWFMFGNIGMLYFNGAYGSAELKPYFEEACSYFGNEVDEYVAPSSSLVTGMEMQQSSPGYHLMEDS